MAKVEFIHKGGRKQIMAQSYAEILQKLNQGTYQTRDMRAAPPVAAPAPKATPAVIDEDEPRVSEAVAEFALLHGVDLEKVVGTGKDGRIKKSDVEAVLAARGTAQ